MKKLLLLVLSMSTLFLCAQTPGGFAINTTGNKADPSAIFDVSSTDKGVLIPRMTTAQRNAIVNPANKLMIMNLETGCINVYDSTASYWSEVCPTPFVAFKDTVFTISGIWIKPPNAKLVTTRLCGAGGGGAASGSSNGQIGGGGGGGGYTEKTFPASTLTDTVTIAVGIGGLGGVSTNGGTSGGASSFGPYCSATGGNGAPGVYSGSLSGGLGGIGINGDLNISGNGGGSGASVGSGLAIGGGTGGGSVLGGGAVSGGPDADGLSGGKYGGGGSGGSRTNGANHNGGPGAPGVVIVRTYF